jgi:predicted O-methyltransferase YrrM
MARLQGEPESPAAVAAWIERETRARDRFADVYTRSEAHRGEHGCDLYPSGDGPLLGALTAATGARRILEVGCGLGYSALWLADGAGPSAHVDTIERDAAHAKLARVEIEHAGAAGRIAVREGDAASVVAGLDGPYDLAFVDCDPDAYLALLDLLRRRVRPGGLLVSSNLFLGQYAPDIPGLEVTAAYRARILDDGDWRTGFLPGGKALWVRTDR